MWKLPPNITISVQMPWFPSQLLNHHHKMTDQPNSIQNASKSWFSTKNTISMQPDATGTELYLKWCAMLLTAKALSTLQPQITRFPPKIIINALHTTKNAFWMVNSSVQWFNCVLWLSPQNVRWGNCPQTNPSLGRGEKMRTKYPYFALHPTSLGGEANWSIGLRI